jgi:hypothetical protein
MPTTNGAVVRDTPATVMPAAASRPAVTAVRRAPRLVAKAPASAVAAR